MILIPFDPTKSADQTLRIQLGTSQVAELQLVWNVRSEHWVMALQGSFGEVHGLKVVPNWPLLRGRESASGFEGDFIVRPLTTEVVGKTIGYFDLGVSWGLLYLAPDEKDQWEVFYGLE